MLTPKVYETIAKISKMGFSCCFENNSMHDSLGMVKLKFIKYENGAKFQFNCVFSREMIDRADWEFIIGDILNAVQPKNLKFYVSSS